ncbi:phosphotransferase-like protein [Nocardia carnea]|uniref:phosphotransferase-like protein n=1 Tax=Nocardia carnea TaxID=37328 RepID=UPI00245772FE|nr:hypothetical protein [Nocardia carnea]
MENKCGTRGARVAAPGRVVLLNGVSSSGKSSIARRLLIDLDRPFFHMGVDMFGAMRSESRTHELDPRDLAAASAGPAPVSTALSREWPGQATTSSWTMS